MTSIGPIQPSSAFRAGSSQSINSSRIWSRYISITSSSAAHTGTHSPRSSTIRRSSPFAEVGSSDVWGCSACGSGGECDHSP